MSAAGQALPEWLDPTPWLASAHQGSAEAVAAALACADPGEKELAALLSPQAEPFLEALAARARMLTARHFGRTVGLYIPLYLSDYCSSGCVYCGFASDRKIARRRLATPEIVDELDAIRAMGFEEILLLTGERSPKADVAYLADAVRLAAERFAAVTVETFPMATEEYRQLAEAGCVGVTLYQETYDPVTYAEMHRWGPKRDYAARLDAPDRLLAAGMRSAGLGALLGLADPAFDVLALYRHARHLRRTHWRSGVSLAFPRICSQTGGFQAPHPVSERRLAQIIWALRICLPDTPMTLSTREGAGFRDGMAGVGVNRMSIASRTSVGGYLEPEEELEGQFSITDGRTLPAFCQALRAKGLEPVYKNWDPVYRG
jgi:2-iminoacetate synthase